MEISTCCTVLKFDGYWKYKIYASLPFYNTHLCVLGNVDSPAVMDYFLVLWPVEDYEIAKVQHWILVIP